jgi:ATP-dependent Lon protease
LTDEARPAPAIANATPNPEGKIELPLLVVTEQILFPHTTTALQLHKKAAFAVVSHVVKQQSTLVIVHQSAENLPMVGVEAAVLSFSVERDAIFLLLEGRRRVLVERVTAKKPFPRATATLAPDVVSQTATRDLRQLQELFQEVVALNDNIAPATAELLLAERDLSALTDTLSALLNLSYETRAMLLNERDLSQRSSMLNKCLSQELDTLEMHTHINSQVQSDMARNQREVYLREQMRIIQGELGETDPFQQDINTLHAQIAQAGMPEPIQTKAMTELARLTLLTPLSPEAGIIRTYIQWLIDLPWQKTTRDNLNLAHAEKVLKKAHYGLEKVKERILEHIAVRKLAGNKMKSPILCFVGPPGVGKTSLGKSIAEALGREFVRVSLGGVRDEAEIRGHRRTYIGAMPGRIIQTMKQAATMNPVFMLDEIDKLGDDYRGDPASALLEVLDPEQNHAFSDHYLDVPFDLSQVLFIATANDLDPLPEALEDRLEVIEFRAYTEEEKAEIARQFLIPKALEAHGLGRRGIHFQADAVQTLIRHYTLEAGVRNLEREIANVCRKLARLVATKKPYPKRVTANLVEKYLGPPYMLEGRVNREDSIGTVTGLVWSPSGGDTQVIEVSLLAGKGNLTLTGQLGDVLQESAQAALSYMRSRAHEFDVPNEDFEEYDVHIHLPEGGVPKDGPSAGVALAIGIISVFTEQKVRSDFALTGEVTLRGNVLPVGGIKEKVLAARRHKLTNVILPADNEKDLVDIPKSARKDLHIHFVKHMQEVIDLMLLPVPEQRQRDLLNADDEGETEAK